MLGVDYESMLSELGKFGASFILATQSLAKLADLSPTMQDTLLANVGCLAVFQVAAADARTLVWELGKDRVSEDDVASLPVHHCYVRATVGTERRPTFSMATRKPPKGDPQVAQRVRAAAEEYTTPAQTIAAREAHEDRLARQIKQTCSSGGQPPAIKQPAASAAPDDAQTRIRTRPTRGVWIQGRAPAMQRSSKHETDRYIQNLRRLAAMPFLDRIELAVVSHIPYPLPHDPLRRSQLAAPGTGGLHPPRHRPHSPNAQVLFLTPHALRSLAGVEDVGLHEILRDYPVSAHWQRTLMERLDALGVIYRLASALAEVGGPRQLPAPIRFLWYRAMPLDAAVILPGRRILGVLRQGLTSDRTAFAKRLWRLLHRPLLSALLVIAPDGVRLRHTRRLLARAPVSAYLALEHDAALADPHDPAWHLPSVPSTLDLDDVVRSPEPGGRVPHEEPLTRAALPGDLPTIHSGDATLDRILPALLQPAQNRTLDTLSDWP